MKNIATYVALALFLFSGCFFLAACDENQTNSSNQTIHVANKTFLMPTEANTNWWQFNSEESWLKFDLNAETFKPHNPNTIEKKVRNLSVRVGSISTMDRGYYWTEKDSALISEPFSCKTIDHLGKKFELCDHGFTGKDKAQPRVYVIKSNVDDAITILECRENLKMPNTMCHARMRLFDNLQVNYGYNISYFERAVEIDQKLREFVLKYYKQP